MVRTLIIMVIVGLLFSCSSKRNQANGESSSSYDFKKFDTTISFSGCWLSEDYYKSIGEFKSPKKAQDGAKFIVIPKRTLQQTVMAYNFHEGGMFLKVLKNKENYEIWSVQDDNFIERLTEVEIISPNKIKIGEDLFTKINPVPTSDNPLILEEILFKGHYISRDGNNVEFKNTGQLTGLDSFQYYSPIIDYWSPGLEVDQVALGKTEKDLIWFGFKFNRDTLELYNLNCISYDSIGKTCNEVEYGKLVYKLSKSNR